MTTRDSGSNLLDEFFASKDGAEEEVEVVDDVEEGDVNDVPVVPAVVGAGAAPRRSVPPPPPSKRASRGPSAPPPRGRGPRTSAPPPPPSAKATLKGSADLPVIAGPPLPAARSTLVGMPEPVFGEPGVDAFAGDAHAPTPVGSSVVQPIPRGAEEDAERAMSSGDALDPFARADEESESAGGLDIESAATDRSAELAAPEAAADEDAPEAREETPAAPAQDAFASAPTEGEADMATALAGSLELRGDTPSVTSNEAAPSATDMAHAPTDGGIFDAVSPEEAAAGMGGPSSAWPGRSKIDEWDDDWAPSLSALGAGQNEAALRETVPESPTARVGSERAPFRLSLPPPPPPPKRAKLPLPRPELNQDEAEEAASDTEVPVAVAPEASSEGEGDSAPPHEDERAIDMEVSPFGGADDHSREDLTRPLPPTELARLAASEEGIERLESDLIRDDVTIPLPSLASGEHADLLARSALPEPYTSDDDLTRPLISPWESKGDGARAPSLPPLRPPPPLAGGEGSDVPLIVAVPPPSVGVMEDAPTIQITPGSGSGDYTPTTQIDRSFSPTKTSPGGRSALPPIPKPAPVPTDFGKRGPSLSMAPVTGSVFPQGFAPNRRWLIGLAAAVLGIVAIGVGLHNRSGSIVVTVAGPSGAAVNGVAVHIDGAERCTSSPCIVKDLKPGMHLISAAGTGFTSSAERAVVLEPGEQIAQHVVLSSEERATAGLSVAAIGTGLHVMVDGRDVGPPPVTLNDVTPGEHTVRVLGDDRYYQPYEETVRLDRGEVRSLGPVRLHVLRGKLELRAGEGSEGAAVSVDGRRVGHLPATIELSADESHEVTAGKPGHAEQIQQIVFDGTAERRVTIAFGPDSASGGGASAPEPSPRARSSSAFVAAASAPARARSAAVAAAPPPAPAAPAGTATLDITSTPPSAVVVNGRPLGTTPLHNVHVGAGKQTVLFVHPSLGRKLASANVAPGGRATIGVKF